MLIKFINQFPEDILTIILNYHPYFFKYKRLYSKTILINDLFHKDVMISKFEYKSLAQKYLFAKSDIYLYKNRLTYNLMICFESNIFDDQSIFDNRIEFL